MNEAAARLLAGTGCDAFLVRDTVNIRWFTGFDGVFDTEQAHALLILPDRMILHTDSRYSGAARAAAQMAEHPVEIDETRESHASFARRMLPQSALLGFEGSIAYNEFVKLAELFPIADEGKPSTSSDAASVSASDIGQSGRGALPLRSLEQSSQPPHPTPGVSSETPRSNAGAAAETSDDAPDCSSAQVGDPVCVPGTALVSTTDAIRLLRAAKTPFDLERLRAAQAVTDAAFSHMVGFIRPGMTERQVQRELDDFMLRNGAEELAFSSIVATGANGANPHAQPSDARLEAGQCVVMDFGAKVAGYCSDMTRMVFIGEPDERLRGAYAVLRQANEQVEAALKPGMTGIEAHEMAERILEEGGFGGKMGHGLGHGVGLEIHELPNLNTRNDKPLEVGNVVTVEPGIYIEGEFGMRLEDCGVLTASGYEPFGTSTHEMVII